MSTDQEYNFVEVSDALREIREQYIAGEPLVWRGPDNLHSVVAAVAMPPSWHFSEEGQKHALDNDLDFWDIYTMVAFQIGYSNGTVREEKNSSQWKEHMFFWRDQVLNAKG